MKVSEIKNIVFSRLRLNEKLNQTLPPNTRIAYSARAATVQK